MSRPKELEGVPALGFEQALEMHGLATGPMLRRWRRRPADDQKPVYCFWTGHAWAAIWKTAETVTLPPLPAGRQRLYDRARTCATCGKGQLDPFQKGPDGKLRYCEPHQESAWEAHWHAERARERVEAAAWAREILADPTVVLAAWGDYSATAPIHLSTVDGQVLLDVTVYLHDEDTSMWRGLSDVERARFTPADRAREIITAAATALTDRRLIGWHRGQLWTLARILREAGVDPLPGLAVADGDACGDRYSRWRGEPSPHGSQTFRWGRDLKLQYLPRSDRLGQQADHIRQVLAEMAEEAPDA